MYPRPRQYQARKQFKPSDYVMPFLILICIGIIFIMVFNLVRSFWQDESKQAAYMHIVEGSAQMKAWGTEAFFDLTGDVVIMQGDEIKSSADAKIIVQFFDGSIMRMDGNTSVSFDRIDEESKTPQIELKLIDGNLWFNMLYRETGLTNIFVTLDSTLVRSTQATIFELENGNDETVRVFSASDNDGLQVDIFSKDGETVVETENVGIGQQIIFNNAVLEKYWAFQSPTVLAAIDDQFKTANWYVWNLAEDNEPTQFEIVGGTENFGLVKVEPKIVENEEELMEPELTDGTAVVTTSVDSTVTTPETTTVTPSTTPATSPATSTSVKKPTISSVAGGAKLDAQGRYQVTSRVATLTGGIEGADKVVVNGFTLQKFKAGDKIWTYHANADFNLMKAGENVYEIYGLDASGNKSESLIIKVFYEPQQVQPAQTQPEQTPVANEAETDEKSSEGESDPVD